MARRCNHRFLVVDSFIEGGGAFCSCLICSQALEISSGAMNSYLPFVYTSPKGEDDDVVVLVYESYIST